MSRFINDNLDLWTDQAKEYVRCANCHQVLSAADQDWREACLVNLVPPRVGSVVATLLEPYAFRERCCPSCGSLLETDLLIEEQA